MGAGQRPAASGHGGGVCWRCRGRTTPRPRPAPATIELHARTCRVWQRRRRGDKREGFRPAKRLRVSPLPALFPLPYVAAGLLGVRERPPDAATHRLYNKWHQTDMRVSRLHMARLASSPKVYRCGMDKNLHVVPGTVKVGDLVHNPQGRFIKIVFFFPVEVGDAAGSKTSGCCQTC